MTDKGAYNIDQIVRTLVTQNNTQWAFNFSQDLYDKAINGQWISLTNE